MGRTFDAIQLAEARFLMRDDSAHLEEDSHPEPEPAPTLSRVPTPTPIPRVLETASTITLPDLPANAPFIEVGTRSLVASPDVLATTPTMCPPASSPALPRLQLRPVPPPLPGALTGTLPPDVVAVHDPAHALAAQYRELLAALLELRPGLGPRVLTFTKALAGTSLTSVLLNLGATAVRGAERRVIVIEADLRQPTLAARLGLPPSPGLVEVLAGIVPIERAVRITAQPNLLVLPAGEVTGEAFDLLRLEPLQRMLRKLALRADLLLLAMPRWDGQPDVVAFSACCDALFLVAPEAEAELPHVQEAVRHLSASGAPLAGTVLLTA